MSEKKYKTTKADFEYFKRQCWWWIRYFGIIDKEYLLYHDYKEGSRAEARTDFETGCRQVWLSTDYGMKITKKDLAKSAFHELYESMLYELTGMAAYVFKDAHINEHAHKLVHIMENTVFEDKWQSTLRYLK